MPSTCVDCDAVPGQFCLYHGSPPTPCPAGSYCAGSTSRPALCHAGYYCTGGAESPTPSDEGLTGGRCPLGHFCPTGTSSAHTNPCPGGRYGAEEGLTNAMCSNPCPKGHFCHPGTALARTSPCPGGRYGVVEGLTNSSCSGLCAPNHFCDEGSVSRAASPCLAMRLAASSDRRPSRVVSTGGSCALPPPPQCQQLLRTLFLAVPRASSCRLRRATPLWLSASR